MQYSIENWTNKVAKEMVEKENAELREDVAQLNELLLLQGKRRQSRKLSVSSVETAAHALKENAGANVDTMTLAKMLNEFYEDIAVGEDLTWEALREKARHIAEWLMDHVELTGTELLEYAQNWRLNEQDLIRDIYDSYWLINNPRTFVFSKSSQINKLKSQHFQRVNKLKADNRAMIEQMTKQRRAEMKAIVDANQQSFEEKMQKILKEYRQQRNEDVVRRKESLRKQGRIHE